MPTPVTDPALLEQLEAAPSSSTSGPKPVTDPGLLAQLEAPAVTTGDAIARGITTGASFGLRDEGQGLIEAGGGSKQASPLDIGYLARGAYRKLTGDPEAEKRYQAAVERERASTKRIEAEQPGAYIGGQIGGALAVPIGAAARGATWGARALAGAKTGAVTGALTGYGEGEGLEGSAKGAAIGVPVGAAIGGVAAPLTEGLVRGAGAAISKPVSLARGVLTPGAASERAIGRAMVEAERSDPTGANRITQRQFQQAPGEAVVGDVLGEPGRKLARSAANISSEARETMNQALDARSRGQGDRLTDWLDTQFAFPNQRAQQQALEATARSTNNAAYRAAERAGQGGLWSPELERLASSQAVADAMRGAIKTSQDEAVRRGMGGFNPKISFTPSGLIQFNRGPGGVPTYPDLRYWDQVRRELSDAAQKAGYGTEERMRLGGLATGLNAELDRLVPAYGRARSTAAHFFGSENALEAGANFATQRFKNDEARAAVQGMTDGQRALFRDGFVARLKQTIAETPDRADLAKRLATSPAARERNVIAMGRQRANELEAMLRTETIMQKLKEAVQGNSTTAMQLIGSGAAGAAGGGYLGFDPSASGLVGAAFLGLKKGGDARMAQHITRLMMSQDPKVLQAGIRAIASNRRNMQLLQNVENAVSRAGAQQGSNAMGRTQGGNTPQYAGAQEYTYGPGEIEDNQAASFNGPQGYPNFNWVNPAGVDAFLASGPMSKNIEDRRGEHSPADVARYRRQMRVEPRADGGPVEEDKPYWVGERGPELFVPEQDGTIDPFARAAARTGRRGRQEGAGTKFVEGGYGIPSLYKMLDQGAQDAFRSAGQLQRTGDQYDPAPVLQQALGAVGAPMVGPAIEGSVLGAGAIRRAAIPQVAKAELKAADAAPYPQYAEAYPPTAPPVLKTDPKSGKEYMGKVLSPEAEQFMKTREGVIADMGQGYQPYYDPAKRTLVDPSKYPGRNVDTLTIQPAKPETIEKYLKDIDAPITRERLRAAFKRGNELGDATNWYFMGQLEKDFVKELGAKEGRKAFLDRFASGMAATTSGQNPTGNLLMSHYLNYLEQTGKPLPTAGLRRRRRNAKH